MRNDADIEHNFNCIAHEDYDTRTVFHICLLGTDTDI